MARSRNTEQREKILSTAFKMFYERGVDSVLMKDIANECEIGISLLHHYFRKKEDMLVHIFYDMIYKVHAFIEHEIRVDLESRPEYSVVYHGVFYHLFYDILTRENNRLLEIYTPVLYNAPLLKRATDFAYNLDSPIAKSVNTPERRFGIYVLHGGLSQIVNIYLSSTFPDSMRNLLDRLLRSYYGGLGFTAEQQDEFCNMVSVVLTDEVLERCYRDYMANVTNFINCEW